MAYGSMLSFSWFRVDKKQILSGNGEFRYDACTIFSRLHRLANGPRHLEIPGYAGNSLVRMNNDSVHFWDYSAILTVLRGVDRNMVSVVLDVPPFWSGGDFFCAE